MQLFPTSNEYYTTFAKEISSNPRPAYTRSHATFVEELVRRKIVLKDPQKGRLAVF